MRMFSVLKRIGITKYHVGSSS